MASTDIDVSDYVAISPQQKITRPHVETNYNDDALNGSSSSSEKPIALLGSATNGQPGVIYQVDDIVKAKRIFGSGDIVDACQLIWNYNGKGAGAGGTIYAMRVEDATPSILNADGLRFTSRMWGVNANKIALAMEKNSLDNTYRVTVDYAPDNYHNIYDNLGKLFQLHYNANAANATATYSVDTDPNTGKATKFTLDIYDAKQSNTTTTLAPTTTSSTMPLNSTTTTTAEVTVPDTDSSTTSTTTSSTTSSTTSTTSTTTQNPAPVDGDLVHIQQVFDLSMSNYSMLYKLMSALSLIPNLDVYMSSNADNTSITSDTLDKATDVNIIFDNQDSDEYNANGWVWAVRGDIVDKLQYDDYVAVSAVYTEPLNEPFGLTNMINGTTGKVPMSWADRIQAFSQCPAYFMVPLTSSAAIHQEVRTFATNQFLGSRNVRAYVGAGFNEPIGRLISRQVALSNERVALVGTSGYFSMPDGSNVHLPAYMVAALAAGVDSSLQIGGAITNKYISMTSVDQNFTSEQLDQLNTNGVICVEPTLNRGVASGFRFVQDVTTYNAIKEPVKNRIGLGEITDFLFDDLREKLEKDWVGVNVKKTSADLLKSYVDSFLYSKTLDPDSYVVDYDPNDTRVELDGDRAWIYFSIAPSQTLDFIQVYGAYSNYTASSSSSSSSSYSNSSSSNILYSGSTDDISSYGTPSND